MKSTFKICQIFLLMCGVFGVDADEVKSVMEGDSVTLKPDPAKIQGFILILWRFGDKGSTIAQIDGKEISYPSHTEIFTDRLQLDHQTGSLTIKNMRTKHSGLYKLQIDHKTGTQAKQEFSVSVYESPSVIAGAEAEMKIVSVTEGYPVTLHVPQLQGNELILWRFGDEGKLIAKHDIEAKSSRLYDSDERFRDRLQLDQTGSLIITNTRNTDSGLYTVKISSNKQTSDKRFSVTVSDSGVSPAAVAGIVVVVLLASAAAAAAVMHYRRPRTTNLPTQMWSVLAGDTVTLNPETEIQTSDEIQWLFRDEDTLIAEIRREDREMKTYEGPDEIFRDRLKLDETTGSLTIDFITTKHTGRYTLKIRRGRETLYNKFFICLKAREIEVTEGEDVTLNPVTEINKDDSIRLLFRDEGQQTLIAQIKGETREIFTHDDAADGRFRGRLKLDETTGSLTINNTRTSHSGDYKLQITSSRGVSDQTFIVTVKVEKKSLTEGDSVTLNPDTEIQRDDQILWMFGAQDNLIAQIRGGAVEIYDDDGVNKRFRGRLQLDETGSLTITDISTEHTGLYKLLTISSSRGILFKKFKVLIHLEYVSVTAGDSVALKTGLTGIQTADEIQWRFGDEETLIAGIKGGTGKTHDVPDERFRDRLELNNTTGDLTIKNSASEHAGCYKVKIRSSKGDTSRTYSVNIRVRYKTVTAGDSVALKTSFTGVQTDDEIQWRFGVEETLIAAIKGGTVKTYDVPDERFRDRLELNETTGDLTINNSTTKHAGCYKLKIRSSEGDTSRTYSVNIRDESRKKSEMKEKNDSRENRVNESATVQMPLLNGEDVV